MAEQTVKCKICGKPYVFHAHYAGDQSACPSCRAKTGSTGGTTVKCPICGKPYAFFSHYAGDQSACPECRSEARGGGDGAWGAARS